MVSEEKQIKGAKRKEQSCTVAIKMNTSSKPSPLLRRIVTIIRVVTKANEVIIKI